MFKAIRITILLVILVIVGLNTWLSRLRSTDWDINLGVVIYPINADNSAATAHYIAGLDREAFQPLTKFIALEGAEYHLALADPVNVELAHEVKSLPPAAPFGGSRLEIMLWSLKMRWWAWRADNYPGPGNIKIFILYYDPEQYKQLDHSFGLQKGLVGVVKAFADQQLAASNNVIITHEFLHTLGATDKYDPVSGLPLFPDGYAEPDKKPLYPQDQAEIMGGKIPISEREATMPDRLGLSVIGPATAREIGWPDRRS